MRAQHTTRLAALMLLGGILACACRHAPPAGAAGATSGKVDEYFAVGRITKVGAAQLNEDLFRRAGITSRNQQVTVKILEGRLAGTEVTVPNEMTDNPAFNVAARPGGEVVLSVVSQPGAATEINIADYHRAPALGALLAVFLGAFLLAGGVKGLKSLVGLAVGIAMIGAVLLPLALRGADPLLSAVGICLVVIATTMALVTGRTRKSLAAALGTIGGVIIAGLSAHLVIAACPLTGLSTEEAQILRGSMLSRAPEFYSGLLAAGMLIGALGVIMDVAVSIASAVAEVRDTDPALGWGALYKKGMSVGRDIMGTMTSTLVLAYTGSALPLLLLMSQMPSIKLINLDLVATEIAAALTGSLGLVCTIPLTAFAAARLMACGDPWQALAAAGTGAVCPRQGNDSGGD